MRMASKEILLEELEYNKEKVRLYLNVNQEEKV